MISEHFVTCLILMLYVSNVAWYGYQADYGRAAYWFAAAQITIVATWFIKH